MTSLSICKVGVLRTGRPSPNPGIRCPAEVNGLLLETNQFLFFLQLVQLSAVASLG
jgi:hypothetical protein